MWRTNAPAWNRSERPRAKTDRYRKIGAAAGQHKAGQRERREAIVGADSSAVDAAGRGVRSQRRIAVGGMLWIGQARIVIDTLLSLAQIGEADAYR